MFAEELSGNANRRRQDANRERRRKLKQEQQKKALQKKKLEAKKEEGSPSLAKPLSNESSSESNATGNIHRISSEKKQLSAVEIANEQRQQRQQAYAQKVACTKIQSFFRAHRSNCRLLADQTVLLSNRLKDLSTLRGILKEQANTDYIPPPATCTTLCQQMLFISRSIPYKSRKKEHREIETRFRNAERDFKLIQQVLDLVLNPGLISRDENINPFAVWLQSTHGKKRIEAMMRLALFTATVSIVNFSTRKSCLDFVDIITGSVAADHSNTEISKIDIRTSIADFCNPILFMRECTKDSRCYPVLSSERYIRLQSTPMDLISLLRHHLVYTTGGAPIPNGSSNFRDSCIPPKQREQADALFKTVLVAIQSIALHERENSNKHSGLSRNLMQRFVSEILTVPLLTWKLSDEALQLLLSGDTCLKGMKKIYLVSLIENFIDIHKRVLSQGCIESVLCKNIPLKKANATPTQCLLANLAQLGTSCVALNGSQRNRQDFEASAVYYRFLTTLVDAIPLSTFSYRDSVVEWVSEGGHHSPVVISPLILEQCRVLVADSWVRKLFRCAMDSQILRTNEVLQKKTNTDLKMEKDLAEVEGSSVASLAAKEARVDRNRSFWKTSGWAKNLSKGVAKMLKSDRNTEQTKTHSTSGKLINTSSVSLKLARGEKKKNTVSIPVPELSKKPNPETLNESSYTSELFQALCCLYAIILSRWGGNGGKDIVRQKRIKKNDLKNEVATTSQEACAQNILSVLCFSTDFLRFSWGMVQSEQISPTIASVPVKSISVRPTYNQDDAGPAIFYVFVESLAYQLILTDDTEIHDLERPIPLHQLRRCILTLKSLLYKASCLDEVMLLDSDSKEVGHDTSYFGLAMIKASCNAMWDLYDRSSRRLLCVPKLWIIEDLMEKELRGCKTENDYVSLLSAPVLRVCPFLVSFKRRLRLFERIVYTNRVEVQGENSTNIFHTNPLKPGIPVRITRGRILEDGLATMNNLGTDMRKRISIQYYNEAGAKESGIDAGGLFKEFWTDLCAIAFDPNYALFRVTEDNCMYPNPSSGAAHGVDHIELFKFLGRILGKSLYESITVHPQFAHFFLSFLRGDYNYLHMFSDLSTIDSQLYSNLMFLKTYDGDAEDLCLTFTVSVDDFGGTREVPLVRNGANIDVTNANKHRYIGLVTKHYVVDRVKEQSEAFTQGLWEVIDKSWLRIFNEPELQVLISGASDGKIDVNDMRAHTQYAGGFTGIDRNVTRFWNVFSSMTSKQQAELLRFVTSCERPPPLGFATLTPPFTIQRVRIMRDGDKLPSASTCFNVLKLPTYSSEKVMKQRLIYAIESGAGFELS